MPRLRDVLLLSRSDGICGSLYIQVLTQDDTQGCLQAVQREGTPSQLESLSPPLPSLSCPWAKLLPYYAIQNVKMLCIH